MKKITGIIIISIALFISEATAQDPHFSQFFNLPLTVNPANTGNFYNQGRVVANFRNQWRGIADPYVTGYINSEFRLLQKNEDDENRFGVGFSGMYDESLGGGLKTSVVSSSIAYNVNLSKWGNRSLLGAGLGFSYCNRRIDFSRLSFQQQFSSNGFDTNLPTGETSLQALKGFFDVSAGLAYTFSNSLWNMNVGVGAFHINEPRQTAIGDENQRVKRRYSMHAQAEFPVSYDKNLQIHALHTIQGNIYETTLGGGITWILDDRIDEEDPLELETLLFYRAGDAVYPYVGLTKSGLYVGLSYDVTTSSLGQVAAKNRSLELSIRYFLPKKRFD